MCDDSFSENSANAICREMGYSGSSSWVSGSSYSYGESQAVLDINLDDVRCGNDDWDSCSYSIYDNCGHSEDVFLTCIEGNRNEFYRTISYYMDGSSVRFLQNHRLKLLNLDSWRADGQARS